MILFDQIQKTLRAATLPFFVFSVLLFFSSTEKSISKSVSFQTDSLFVADTVAVNVVKDSTVLYTPHSKHGLLSFFPKAHKKITKYQLQWINYTAGSDVLAEKLPVVPLHLGNYGLWNTTSFNGSGFSDQAVRFNGRSLSGIISQQVPLDIFPLEFVESMEIITGVDAITYSDNASGALINLQEIRYNTSKPYTRLWYSQGGNNYIAADGVYSQNVAPNLNLTLGFRRMFSDGRFSSSGVDAWNVRTKLQYSLSNQSIVSFTYMYTNHEMGAFGGLNSLNTDNITSTPWYVGASTVLKRNDATITYSTFFENDSSGSFTAMLYYSNALTEQKNIPFVNGIEVVDTTYKEQEAITGASFRYEQTLLPKESFFTNSIRTGAEIELLSTNESISFSSFSGSRLSGYGLFQQHFGPLSFKGSFRTTFFNDQVLPSVGVGINLPFTHSSILTAEVLQSTNSRRITEPLNQKVVNTVYSMRYSHQSDSLLIEPYLFFRVVDATFEPWLVKDIDGFPIAIEYKFAKSRSNAGIGFTLKNSFWKIFYSLNTQYTYQGFDVDQFKNLPDIYGSLECYYQHLAGSSIGRLGIRVRGNSAVNGFTFSPINSLIVRSEESVMPGGFNGIDVFASAKLGDAYVRLTYMNVINQTFGLVPIYPQLDGNFRISVGWAFLE